MKKEFYSNGKLLITAEYVILDGAKALALPTKFGQYLLVEDALNKVINWTSYDSDKSIWFKDIIKFSSIINKELFDETQNFKNTLIEILHEAYILNSNFITKADGYSITTELTFPKFWGLGTSSTLINNIAQWLQIDAFTLLKNSFGGSGYDIACAQNNTPILYQIIDDKPVVENIIFKPSFTKYIYFVYLNKKQSSKSAIASYYKKQASVAKTIEKINVITKLIIETKSELEFAEALKKHEKEMSLILELQTVQETLFKDFDGVIKSLGAWGGDFVMVVSKENPTAYFTKKGFTIILPYKDMIL